MAKENKAKINLKELKKQGQLYGLLGEMSKMPSGHQQLSPYLGYLKNEHKVSDDELSGLKTLILHDTSQIGTYLNHYIAGHQDNTIKEVKKDTRAVLSKLEEGLLTQMAMPHLGDDNYKIKTRVLESGEAPAIGSITMGLYKSEAWQMAASNASSVALKEALEGDVTRNKKEYMTKDLGWEAGKGINKSMTASYLAPKIETDEEKLQIGLAYASQK